MDIIVCVKQVPDTNEVRIDPVKGTLIREGVPSILNPDDANALEAALQIKDSREDVKITVLTMGPPQADTMLRECLAMGADEAVLLSDRAFAGADTWATSNTLAAAVRKLGVPGLLFAGRQAIDGDTAQVGPQLAVRLNLPQVTYVEKVVEVTSTTAVVHRQLEDGYEVIEVKTPCLLTAVKELNQPRYMNMAGIVNAFKKDITVWGIDDLDIEAEQAGLSASPTQVFKSFTPPPKGKGQMLQGTAAECAAALVAGLKEQHLL